MKSKESQKKNGLQKPNADFIFQVIASRQRGEHSNRPNLLLLYATYLAVVFRWDRPRRQETVLNKLPNGTR